MEKYDVVIVGASFSGLTLAHHLPAYLKVLVVDAKPEAGSTVESTGLITSATRDEFAGFFDIDKYITNKISSICVVSPDFNDYFVSSIDDPWIYQTDTKALVRAMAETVPANVTIRTSTIFLRVDNPGHVQSVFVQTKGREPEEIRTHFLVGADGSHSKVASSIPELDQNKRFLFGYEQVFFGEVSLGPNPEETIYHFWFGEFSLGYGGWLSPTIVDGRKAFRVGLAKLMEDRGDAKNLTAKFVHLLEEKGIVRILGNIDRPGYVFGSLIPIGGTLDKIYQNNVVLIGDTAGFCGAFAADGIKGSIISGKEVTPLIMAYLEGNTDVLAHLKRCVNAHGELLRYYERQMKYRRIWDLMKRDRTFKAMYNIIKSERNTFLEQFCDSKDRHRSLTKTVLKLKHAPKLVKYAVCIALDQVQKFSPEKQEAEDVEDLVKATVSKTV